MKLCFMEGCDQEVQITVNKTVHTRGQLGNSRCEISIPFCSIDHAVAFERLYPTMTEQMATIARLVANYESKQLTVEQLEHTTKSLVQMIDINLGGQETVIIPREEFEELHRARRMLASTQRQLNGLRRDLARSVNKQAE
jgi:methylase of polypeptide subunit release factors